MRFATLATRYEFSDLEETCNKDGGKLWGASLCGPVMVVDPASHALLANRQPSSGGSPGSLPGLFVSVLPQDQGIANTSIEWRGVRWVQVRWPLPADPIAARILLVHESFHRLQDEQQWSRREAANAHLDTLEGRLLLQLEWRALAEALRTREPARRQAISDALLFRRARREHFPTAAEEERSLEQNEGLAEYTGVKLSSADAGEQRNAALRNLLTGPDRPSFMRSFAYATGPAYGLLLDEAGADWRGRVKDGGDLAEILSTALKLTPIKESVLARGTVYGGDTLRASEVARETAARERAMALRKKLVDGPVVRLALANKRLEFNPGTLVALGDHGTVYPTAHLADDWGSLTVSENLLMGPGWSVASVAGPPKVQGSRVTGDGWTLELNPGWGLQPGERSGDFRLRPPKKAKR